MKQKDLKKYRNDELRELMQTIRNNGMAKLSTLPLELQEYINAEKPVGNEMTRAWRLFKLAEEEVVKRFLCKELIETNTVSWIEGRIAELQEERNTHQLLYDKSNGATLLLTVLLTKDAKLKAYKEILYYMQSHNVE